MKTTRRTVIALIGASSLAAIVPAWLSQQPSVPETFRMSADSDDPGYAAFRRARAAGWQVDVKLDGVMQQHCVTADPHEGFVLRAKLNADGDIYAEGDEVAKETKRGKVEIILRKTRA